MFNIGDTVVYGTTGVCKIADITPPPVRGMDPNNKYFLLRPLYQDGKLYTPVHGAEEKMRPVITREQAEKLIAMIPTMKAETYQADNTAQLAERYQQIFSSNNCLDLAELVLSLYVKKQHLTKQRRRFGQVDERFMKRAQTLLHGELATALGIPFDEVEDYVLSRVNVPQAD